MNSVFVKALLPMLPSRLSTIIGELAWNPWQWGDVMPQRRSMSNHRSEEDANLGGDERASHAPSPTSIPWSFLRSSPLSNQMHLSTSKSHSNDLSEMSSDESVLNLIEPVRGLILFHQNKTGSEEKMPERLTVNSDDTNSAVVFAEQDMTKTNENQNSRITTIQAPDDDGSKTDSTTVRSFVLPPASVAQPKIPNPQTCDADGTVESKLYLQEKSNQTWLPLPSMMEKKDYDFRDRRLDY